MCGAGGLTRTGINSEKERGSVGTRPHTTYLGTYIHTYVHTRECSSSERHASRLECVDMAKAVENMVLLFFFFRFVLLARLHVESGAHPKGR